jgi:hypothetical protein
VENTLGIQIVYNFDTQENLLDGDGSNIDKRRSHSRLTLSPEHGNCISNRMNKNLE